MDRRKWFRNVALAGGAIAFNPLASINAYGGTIHPLDDGSENLARLCYNENPFGPSKIVRQGIIDSFDVSHMYPFQFIEDFAHKLAKHIGVSRGHIVLTAGSREGLNSTALTFSEEGGNIVAPFPTYQSLMTYAKQFGMHVYDVPLDKDFNHDLEGMEKRINNRTSLVFICNPNNPTGTIMTADQVRPFCKSISGRSMLFVDEAYIDYVTDANYSSMIDLVKEDYNVIVSRTFSKVYGLAGIRMGFMIARPDIASRIRQNLMAAPSITAIKAASTALDDDAFYTESLSKNTEAKEHIYKTLDDLGLKYVKSHTNFIFFHTGINIVKFNAKMKEKGVLVGRPFPPLMDWCRISTGKMEDVIKFSAAIKEVMV